MTQKCCEKSTTQSWQERFRKHIESVNSSKLKSPGDFANYVMVFIQQELDRQRQDIREIVKGMAMDIDEQGIGYFKAIKDLLEKL